METLRGMVSSIGVVDLPCGQYGEWVIKDVSLVVGGRRVKFESWGAAPKISPGDDVILCGRERSSTFVALAYRNLTTRGAGNVGLSDACIRAALVGIFALSAPRDGSVFGLIVTGFFVYLLARAVRISLAVNKLGPV